MKRFSVNLTDEEHEGLKKASKKYKKPMSELMRIYLRLGLSAERPYTDLIIRKRSRDTCIKIVE